MKLDFEIVIKASIVSIGNEILSGQTVDTNAAYLSDRLLTICMPVASSYTVADDIDLIVRSLKLAGDEADVVLATGGLGPTDDDLTRQAFAKLLGVQLQLQDDLLQKIQDFFASRNSKMPDKCKIQAHMPAGAKVLANNLGTAPGIITWKDETVFVAMPGVPSEMKQMFEESVLPELKKLTAGQAVVIQKLKCFGTGESNIAELLGNLLERGRNPLINCTAENGTITLHIIATAKDKDKAQQMVENSEKLLRNKLGKLVYGTGEQTLAEVVGKKLIQQKKTIAIVESCTGGNLSKLLTDVPGASQYFSHGWVTYSNSAKTDEVGVPSDLIVEHGAVSSQVAEAMARGALKRARTDFAVSITGIAGPTGGSEQKPVGLVYISVCSDNKCDTERFIFSHGRNSMRCRAAKTALNMLRLRCKFD